nr:hypothetical protein [Fluoribacter gormanii]
MKADIAVLEKQQDTIAEKMMNATDDNEAHALANDLNSMNQKIINLKEIVAVKEGGKKFIDADGNSEDKNGNPINFKNAAFVVAKDQNIAKDEEGSYYLLKDKQKFDDMSPEEKKTAQEDFKRAKMDIKVVKDVVEDVKTEELDFNTTRMAQNKVEQSLVQKQLDLQHEARRDAEKNLAQKKDQPAKSEPAKSEPAKSEPKSTPKEKNPYLALNDQMAQVVAEIQGIINDGLKDLAKAGFDKAKQTAIGQSLGRLSDAITQKGDELKQELMDKVGEKLDDLKNSKQGQAVGALKDTLGSVKDAISRGLVSGIDKIIDKVKDIGSDENPDNSIELSSPANSITSLISRAKNWFDSIDFEKLAKEPESTPKPTESPSLEEESTSTMKTR